MMFHRPVWWGIRVWVRKMDSQLGIAWRRYCRLRIRYWRVRLLMCSIQLMRLIMKSNRSKDREQMKLDSVRLCLGWNLARASNRISSVVSLQKHQLLINLGRGLPCLPIILNNSTEIPHKSHISGVSIISSQEAWAIGTRYWTQRRNQIYSIGIVSVNLWCPDIWRNRRMKIVKVMKNRFKNLENLDPTLCWIIYLRKNLWNSHPRIRGIKSVHPNHWVGKLKNWSASWTSFQLWSWMANSKI